MICARQRAVTDAIAVYIFVAREAAQTFQIRFVEDLSAIDGFLGYLNDRPSNCFMPKSKSDITNTTVWNRSARSNASPAW